MMSSRTMRCRPVLTAALAVLAAAFSAVSSAQAETPVQGGEIVFGVTTEPVCFDPHRSSQQNAYILIRNYVDSLVAKAEGGKFLPWLASSWTISSDGKTYVFKLREDVRFHDGARFDAEAVKANFDYVRDVKNTAGAGDLLKAVSDVRTLGSHEVEIVLNRPDSSLLESISSIRLGILSPKSLDSGASLCAGGPALAATGPFVFQNYTRGESVTFAKNPDYAWGPGYAAHQGPAYLDKVAVRFLPEYAVRAGALKSGQVDVIEGVQPADVALFKDQPDFQFLVGPSGASTSFTLNINYTHPPADDVRVRRALRDGADIGALVQSVYQGTYRRAWSNIGLDNYYFDKSLENAWGNDVAGANKLLDDAGWTQRDAQGYRVKDGKRLSIEVGYPQPYVRDNRDILIQGLQAQLRKNLGFDLKLRIITGGEWAQQLKDGSWTIYPNTYLPADAAQELQGNIGESGFIRARADKGDRKLFDLINGALAATDPEEKKKLVFAAQTRAVDQAFIVPLFAANYQLGAKEIVKGLSFETQLDSPSNFYDVWLAKP
ncbi:ABC transporter substrate-binding protein [Bordetella tumulicola]|uniref:ABC transporter substrate-binding protein n=1 Tax=Bordetella tumulicola TaxID=1649133 RepID=UPI0039EE5BA8